MERRSAHHVSPDPAGRPVAGVPARSRQVRPAFSFVEILFAIMILGIGFIMVAAMLPPAIVQTQETVDQTAASQVAKNAVEVLEQVATNKTMPSTTSIYSAFRATAAPVWPFGDFTKITSQYLNDPDAKWYAWQSIKGKMIYASDPRYAFTTMYSREFRADSNNQASPPSYAQVYVLVTRARNRETYSIADVSGLFPNLRIREVDIELTEGTPPGGTPAPDIIEFFVANNGPFNAAKINTPLAVAEGTFVIVSEDRQAVDYRYSPTSSTTRSAEGMANGRVYRVGARRPDLGPNKWELMPGFDMPSGIGCGGPGADLVMGTADDNQNIPVVRKANASQNARARALIMGRGSINPSDQRNTATSPSYEGPAQDVALFSTFVPVK
ncbi:MAG TPA: hypothetical protein VEA69_00070 [Tepidisphaeraceae bacterium]|nr:hypothetical protein [Tepidisphaeraceae bacterium]